MRDKGTFITIVVLLVIFLPLGVFGAVKHKSLSKEPVDNNTNKEFLFEGKVYFYDEGVLKGSYECSNCDKAVTKIDDTEHNTHFYKKGTDELYPILNSNYGIFLEGESTNLYNFGTKMVTLKFSFVKNYNVSHKNPVLIVSNSDGYGVINVTSMMPIVPIVYDYIAIPNRVVDGILDTSKFIASKNGMWVVIDDTNQYLMEAVNDEIVDFNDRYIVTKNLDGNYSIWDYKKNAYLPVINKKEVYCIGDYIAVLASNNVLNVYKDINQGVVNSVTIANYKELELEMLNNIIEVFVDGRKQESIVLS